MKWIIFIAIVFVSCGDNQTKDLSKKAEEEIRQADIAMSELAAKQGFFQALLQYAEDSIIIPRDGRLPLMTKSEAAEAWADRPVIREITWKPDEVLASRSGDLGYSFGYSVYKGADTTTYTNYCTIWRKQKDGSWKFLYDAGNNIPMPGLHLLPK